MSGGVRSGYSSRRGVKISERLGFIFDSNIIEKVEIGKLALASSRDAVYGQFVWGSRTYKVLNIHAVSNVKTKRDWYIALKNNLSQPTGVCAAEPRRRGSYAVSGTPAHFDIVLGDFNVDVFENDRIVVDCFDSAHYTYLNPDQATRLQDGEPSTCLDHILIDQQLLCTRIFVADLRDHYIRSKSNKVKTATVLSDHLMVVAKLSVVSE